jgi:beta-N-acetylhexosaminidase
MQKLAAVRDPELMRRVGAALGAQLRALGITMNFAPVLDVDTNPKNPVIGDRAFGHTAAQVIEYAFPFADGLRDSGVYACGKHFPGHGDTDLDSHMDLPTITHSRERLETVELPPFRAARGRLAAIMTAHVVFESIEPHVPSTLSSRAIQGVLRGELGYDGVVLSDDLEMKAIRDRFGVGDAACQAIAAGCDAVLICSQPELYEEAKDALARAAARDRRFAEQLRAAGQRFASIKAPPEPRALTTTDPLDDPEIKLLEQEIWRRVEDNA